ncbi:MAG: insulinase family protein [Myxococcales bacterium]|nr:insulinase family protein [Myxococcales bacterium]
MGGHAHDAIAVVGSQRLDQGPPRTAIQRFGSALNLNVRRHATELVCTFPVFDEADPDKMLQRALVSAWNATSKESVARGQPMRRWRYIPAELVLGHVFGVSVERDEVSVHLFHETGRPDWFNLKEIVPVGTPPQLYVQEADERWAAPERAVRFLIEPTGVDVDALPERHADRTRPDRAALDPESVDEALLSRVIAPPSWDRAATRTLENGLQLVALQHGTEHEDVQVGLFLPGGSIGEPERALDLWTWEASFFKRPPGIVFWWDRPSLHRSWNAWSIRNEARPEDLEDRLKDLQAYAKRVVVRRRYLRDLKGLEQPRPNAHRWAEAFRAEHLGIDRSRWNKSFRASRDHSAGDMRKWLRGHTRPGGATLVVLGPVDPQEALGMMQRAFERWKGPSGQRPRLPEPVPPPAERAVILVHGDTPMVQSAVAMTCRLSGRNSIAGEVATSIVQLVANDALRRATGSSYGVLASVQRGIHGDVLELQAMVQRQSTGRALTLLESTVKRLADTGPTEVELARARLDVARRRAEVLRDTEDVLHLLGDAEMWDDGPSTLAGRVDELMSTDAAAIGRVLEPCVGREVFSGRASRPRPVSLW